MILTQVKRSGIHGRGVFAIQEIPEGEIIECCHVITVSEDDRTCLDSTKLYNFYFSWVGGAAIALGNGSLYNHSYSPNAIYQKIIEDKAIAFKALRAIKQGEEITVNYNGDPSSKSPVWFDT